MRSLTKLSKQAKIKIIQAERKTLATELKSDKKKTTKRKIKPRIKQLVGRLLAKRKMPESRVAEVVALDLIDRASLFATMLKEDMTATEAARYTGYSNQHIRTSIEILTLPATVQGWIRNRWLSAESGYVLAMLAPPTRNRVLRKAEPFMSLREVKRLVQVALGDDAPLAFSIKGERANASTGRRIVWRGQREKRAEAVKLCQSLLDKQSAFTDYQRGMLVSLFWDMGLLDTPKGKSPSLNKLRNLAKLIVPPDE